MITTSRLGEAISLGRDPGSLKTHKTLAWTRSRAQHAQLLPFSLRRTSLAWARVCVAQNQSSSLGQEPRVR